MFTKWQLQLLTQIRHMLIEPQANQDVVKRMRHVVNGYFLTRK